MESYKKFLKEFEESGYEDYDEFLNMKIKEIDQINQILLDEINEAIAEIHTENEINNEDLTE